ncbi:hypothetical protein Clacol_001614 [Clathrus columnatus]|uniref:Cleavage and polyadenylation specificity factor subunit 2 n=1 Tax=Clathrus columnatus TaxID=1419009 RepID=A0AAV4ZYM3_9AGAM|nr:hypothetical protein Clacol_001614 [Clathrus columnatus]
MITFTPLSGGAKSTHTTPLCYLLQVDDVRILLDCGSPDWNRETDDEDSSWDTYIRSLESLAYTVDLVLLSHGDLAHAGLIPYAYSHWNLRAPAYCTLPVQAMSRIAVANCVESLRSEEAVEPEISSTENHTSVKERPKKFIATLKQVHDSFDAFTALRYSQPTHLQGKCQGLTITPYNAGHTLGGTIWKIRSPSSGTIIYAVDLNHTRERHLDGTVILRPVSGSGVFEPLARPDLLITDAERATLISSRRKDRDLFFLGTHFQFTISISTDIRSLDLITNTLRTNSLLIPCDASTRVLELLVLLDQHWSYSKLKVPICLISNNGEEMLTFVRSMMEWLGGTITKEDIGEDGKKRKRQIAEDEQNLGAMALRFPYLEFFSSPPALTAIYPSSKPKLILAVPASLSHGSSRALFADFASVPGNVVLLTSRSEEGTLSDILIKKWHEKQSEEERWEKDRLGHPIDLDEPLLMTLNSKVPLQGAELEAYLQNERLNKEREAAQQAAMARTQMMLEADEDDSDSDDSDSRTDDEMYKDLDDPAEDQQFSLAIEPGGGDDHHRQGKRSKVDLSMNRSEWLFDQEEAITKQLLSYDIFLKGKMSRTTSFFKTAAGQAQRFRMFPFIERKRRVDEYGETVDVSMWLRKGKALEDAGMEDTMDSKTPKSFTEETKMVVEPPSKYVSHVIEVHLSCKLCFIDMEGLNDGRALKTIVPQVNPRKMIIVHASSEATDSLLESCKAIKAMTKEIYSPAVGESCQIGQHTNSFSISLSDELLSSIRMSRFEDNEVGFVVGRVVTHNSSSIPTLGVPPAIHHGIPNTDVRDDVRSAGLRPVAHLPRSTMIGDLKLTVLKTRLMTIGIPAEFAGEGVLVCGAAASKEIQNDNITDTVAVRKLGRGKVIIEGTISKVYYAVRKEVYDLHALIAA